MYSRRPKLSKKKPKPSRTKQTPGSNWGPRLALIERERAIASGAILDDDEEEIYDIQHELVHRIKKSSPGTSGGGSMSAIPGGPTGRLSQHFSSSNHYGSSKNNNNDSSTAVDPVLRLGRSSSPNYFYYNYSRRTAPNAPASSQRKISCPEPSSSVHSQQQQQRERDQRMINEKTSSHSQIHHQQQQHHRRASYVLGSSSGYCSGSVTTLSTCANNSNSDDKSGNNNNGDSNKYSKPLMLIIPPHDGHRGHRHPPLEYIENGHDQVNGGGGDGILLKRGVQSGRQHHDHRHQDNDHNDFGTEEKAMEDSFPSSSAYQSSGDEENRGISVGNNDGSGPTAGQVGGVGQVKRYFQNPMAHMNRKKTSEGGNVGILQISTKKEVVQVHAAPKQSHSMDDTGTATEPETLEMGADAVEGKEDRDGNNEDKVGSTITALHKGITMVYVPMKENGGDNNSNNNSGDDSSEDMPELGQQLSDNDCCSASTSSSYRGGGAASKEPEDSLMSSNFILKKKQEDGHHSGAGTSEAPVLDSLLDSFESLLFKPKPGEALQKCQEKCQQQQQNENVPQQVDAQQHKGIRKRPEQPPPLPPAGVEQHVSGQQQNQQKQKSLRFALENLETVLNPSSLRTPSPSSSSGGEGSASDHRNSRHVPPPPKKVLKKVTLSLPGEDAISSRNHELLLNYEELNNCATEILSCGHVRNDDYSTLSSMTSSAQEISDLEEMINGCSGSGHNDGGERGQTSNTNSSGGESDAGSNLGSTGSANNKTESPQQPREPRSVLQQLRDLSRLIRGNSPTKKEAVASQAKKETVPATSSENSNKSNDNSFYLHNNSNNGGNATNTGGDTEIAKRKTSDATDNSADSGKGSGSGTSASGSSGQEGSSASSAEPSPNNTRGGVICINKGKSSTNGGNPFTNQKILQQTNGRRLKIATIRGRGGGTGSRHYCPTDEEARQGVPMPPHTEEGDDSCSQRSSVCSCQDCCDYRSDCNECMLYSKPPNSQELCSNEARNPPTRIKVKQQHHPTQNLPPPPPPPSQQRAPKQSVSKLLVRRTSSRIRAAAARRTASLKRVSQAKLQLREMMASGQRKPVILDYCDCSNCDVQGCGDHQDVEDVNDDEFDEVDYDEAMEDDGCWSAKNCRRQHPSRYQHHDTLLIPINHPPTNKKSSGSSKCKSRAPDPRKISSSSGVSSSSSSNGKPSSRIAAIRSSSASSQQQIQKQVGSQLLRQSDAAFNGAAMANNPVSVVPLGAVPSTSTGNLFTIDEANEDSVYGEASGPGGASGGGPVVIGKGRKTGVGGSVSSSNSSNKNAGPRVDFHLHDNDPRVSSVNGNNSGNRRMSSHSQHSHPKCWLAPDATLGWSDLESLYSQNMKFDSSSGSSGNKRGGGSSKKGHPLPAALRDECPTCWKELSEMKKNCPDPTRTVDRTKRMFIWLNRRHKEFHAPWWEAKKQASMRWLVTKSFAHAVPKDKIPDPFKESKKGKPTKYSLRDEIVKGLVSGRLYCMALDSLYRSQQNNYHLSQNLTHWEIIKILSRRGIYIAQPSDMKLTETTLRQKKPIRTAAHIALIEAMMGLFAKEILGRDRIAATLRSFGRSIEPDTNSPERLVISWINTAVTTLKSYILSNAPQQLPANKVNRWLNLPDVGEIRDLCDGVGVCALFALYCSNDLKIEEISVPEPGDTLTIYDSITNHSLVQKLCEDLFPEPIYHLCVTDFLYIHGCMKQNILCFLVDLFVHLEINPILRVNRLTHVPIRVEL